ncbi:MAG TPA: PSD1 and planctomycete cytochrome C domain-containing protein [Pirellulales bacterium]|nr:PSD1 and planctomycete cytochrome C domain-containing protein [Pirellulales bacterium]
MRNRDTANATRIWKRQGKLYRPTFVVLLAWLCGLNSGEAAEPVRYNRDVLPILADNCFACHGFDKSKREAELRLDLRESAAAELPSGVTAIVPGKPAESALWERVSATDEALLMPPAETGKRLTAAERDVLRRWIEQGAEYEPHWAYLPPQRVEPPPADGSESAIDRFIRSRLAAEKIEPSPEADRHTLLRRVTLDLTGLPPSPLEVDAFVNDRRDDAYERVVDRLLASVHFGERWARWWLDLAHYADTDGYLQDFLRPVAWRYRQWVVDAFNRDLPFDEFTIYQLAGDLLPGPTASQRMGTGFLRNTLSNREGGADLEEFRVKQVIDRTATVATTWLALTIGCAECHDHKFDAITQREFYQLYAFFNDADEVNFNAPLPGERAPWETAKQEHDRKRAELLAPVAAPLAELQADWERRMLETEAHPGQSYAWDRALELLGLQWGQDLGEGQLEGLNIIKTPLAERTQDQKDRLLDYFLSRPPAEFSEKFKELKISELRSKLEALAKELSHVTRAPAMMKAPAQRVTHVHIRGDFRRAGEVVQPGTLAALPPLLEGRQADRLALARWLVSPEHPLTARVAVNRMWQELFGRGLVATSENFGVRGDRPSHAELLDWLAIEFVRGGWSVKVMLKQIVMSQTYRQTSAARPDLAERDPNNVLLARQVRLRLSAEAVRDSALAASGLLCRTVGGPSVKPPQPESVSKEAYRSVWEPSEGADRYRRGLYTFLQRTSPFAQFVTFDLPDASRSCTRRERSNTPLQALNLLNDPVFLEAAQAFAARVLREERGTNGEGKEGNVDERRLSRAFLLALGRNPQGAEVQRLLAYLRQQQELFESDAASAQQLLQDTPLVEGSSAEAAWVALCSVLLNLDEAVTRE